jgi:hypothetical protein
MFLVIVTTPFINQSGRVMFFIPVQSLIKGFCVMNFKTKKNNKVEKKKT